MPLHLLGKKSWNVYNTSNISQVRADEAAAALRQDERDRLTQEQDAQIRTAILRGEEPPTFAPLSPEDDSSKRPRRPHDDSSLGLSREERKRFRKGRDEDETSHAIRVAQMTRETGSRASLALQEAEKKKKKKKKKEGQDQEKEVQITDHAGHIQLFAPPDETQIRHTQKNDEFEKEKKRKERQLEDQYTMRFSNAAGFSKDIAGRPWYAATTTTTTSKSATTGGEGHEAAGMSLIGALGQSEKDVWGRPDPARKEREEKRSFASDPFAFMQKAQGMLKQSERDREKWRAEKERELLAMRKAEKEERESRRREREERRKEKEERRARKERDGYRDRSRDGHGTHEKERTRHRDDRRRRDSVDSLEGFSLDAPAQKDGKDTQRSRDDHNRDRRRHSRERHERERHERERHGSRNHGHGHERERSRDGERSHRSSRHESSHRRRSRSPRRG